MNGRFMKRIVILTCPKAEDACTGGACFEALNRRAKAFSRYKGEEVEVLAFMKCSGCGHFPENDKELAEKMRYVLDRKPDAVHIGGCCYDGMEGKLCKEITALQEIFESHGIPVIRGTHSIF